MTKEEFKIELQILQEKQQLLFRLNKHKTLIDLANTIYKEVDEITIKLAEFNNIALKNGYYE